MNDDIARIKANADKDCRTVSSGQIRKLIQEITRLEGDVTDYRDQLAERDQAIAWLCENLAGGRNKKAKELFPWLPVWVPDDGEERACSLCGAMFEGRGHNPAPLADGRCCGACNAERVLPESDREETK